MPPRKSTAERFMKIALAEARKGLGRTAPNPAVGAVLVKNDRIIAKGFHRAAGLPHAEIEALSKVGFFDQSPSPNPRHLIGATLYVTLEPCSSHGKTPPCTEAIIAAGITRVVYGATDPDKRHRGRASRILRKAGVEVVEGCLEKQCMELNRNWNHLQKTGFPWVIAKAALSLDGWIDSPPHRRWISSPASRREAMRIRSNVEAILVGGGTVRTDNPSLTVRGLRLPKGHPQPWRIIWSRSGEIPKDSKLLTDAHRDRTILLTGVSLREALRELARRGIASVLIEGGGRTLGEAFHRHLVDEVRFFLAPVVQGGKTPVLSAMSFLPTALVHVSCRPIGHDLMITAMVKRPKLLPTPSGKSSLGRQPSFSTLPYPSLP